ncbi:MAG: NMD3-related protein [Candidatus Altarchaeaceae archaeon]
MFCARCGKKIKYYGLCLDCYLELNPITMKNFEIYECSKCNNFINVDGKEIYGEKEIKEKIKRNLIIPEKINLKKIDVKYEKFQKILKYSVKIHCEYNGENFEKEISGNLKILKRLCINCSRSIGGYYEAVIQFRDNKEKIKEMMNLIDKKYISKFEEKENGVDIYLISKEIANSLIKKFSEEGAKIIISKSIGGVKDGVRVYRKYICVRFPDINPNDYVIFKNKIYKVLKVKKILECERDGKIKRIPIKDVIKVQEENPEHED